MKCILASASPRRKELLEQIGMEFEVVPARGEEAVLTTNPKEAVLELSRQKAREVAAQRAGIASPELIIGADTVVALEGEILGKPKDEADAYRMLSMLQGKSHRVYTGVTLLVRGGECENIHSFYEETKVVMYSMSEEERRWYIGTKEPFDKAGGYAIQGRCAVFVKEIQGDYNNVVGLPVARIYQELQRLAICWKT